MMKKSVIRVIVVVVLVIVIVLVLIEAANRIGSGVEGKTLWDWLTLLGVIAIPVGISAAAIWFNEKQDKLKKAADERERKSNTKAAEREKLRSAEEAERERERSEKNEARARELHREDIWARNFAQVVEYERKIDFSKKMSDIRKLSDSYEESSYASCEETIIEVVNFLNYIAHLIRHSYIDPYDILLLYSPALTTCREKLIKSGWINNQRNQSEKRYYLHFQTLCNPINIEKLWRGDVDSVRWPTPRGVPKELAAKEISKERAAKL